MSDTVLHESNVPILYVINGLTRNNGKVGISGGDIRLAEIAKNQNPKRNNFLTTPNGAEFIERLQVPHAAVHLIPYTIDGGIKTNLLVTLRSWFALPRSVKSFKGIVYSSCEHLYDVLPALWLQRKNDCTWLAVYHWVEEYPWNDTRGGTPFLRRYAYWLQRYAAGLLIKKYANRVLAVSTVTKQKLIDMKGIASEKIQAVACGVNVSEITAYRKEFDKQSGEQYDAIYMKRLNNGKGIWDLLEIWKEVVKHKPTAKLAIIGDGPESTVKEITTWINENGLEKNITLLGVIYDPKEKFKQIISAKLFVLPSHEENWAIVIGEAMAAGLPVIAYELKEIVPIWKDAVAWVPLPDKSAFAHTIISALDSDSKRTAMTKKGLEFIKEYDWATIAAQEFNAQVVS
jgi:glycosyltransferase involved in cell wall biosynthesis